MSSITTKHQNSLWAGVFGKPTQMLCRFVQLWKSNKRALCSAQGDSLTLFSTACLKTLIFGYTHSTRNSEHRQKSKPFYRDGDCSANNSLPAKFLSVKELLGTFLWTSSAHPSLYKNSSEDTAGNGSEISSVTDEIWWEQILFIYLFHLQPHRGLF